MAYRMKRKTRRKIFQTLFEAFEVWLKQADKATNHWTEKPNKWPFLRTGIYSYDKPKSKKEMETGPRLKGVDTVRLQVDGSEARIMVRKENICIGAFVWDEANKKYVLIIHNSLDTANRENKFVHKTWFLFFMARRALIHALTMKGIAAGGYKKLTNTDDNITVIYDGLSVVFGGNATTPVIKSTWLRFAKVRALANKLICSFIKNPEKRQRAVNRVDNFVTVIQNLISPKK